MSTKDNMIIYGQKLTNVAGNTSPTIEIAVNECVSLTVYYKLTIGGAGTAATITGEGSPDDGTTYFMTQSSSVAAGTGTLTDFTWDKGTLSTVYFKAGFDCSTDTKFKLTLAVTNGEAADKIDAWVVGYKGR